jgi:hypothetical protein
MIRVEYKRISNGRNAWHISGAIKAGAFVGIVYGDVTDAAGIAEALRAMIASKPRYQRVAVLA